jgi:predicted aconitase
MAGSYWEVPVIEGLEVVPTSDEAKHLGAAMASYGSTPLFHLAGITPEAQSLADIGGDKLTAEEISKADLDALRSSFGRKGDKVDVVVFAAPQLSIVEMQQVAGLVEGKSFKAPILVCTSPQVYADATRMKIVERIEATGAKVLEGTCYYNQYAREIGEANGWTHLLSNSAKIVNILGGYGYEPALASMEDCVASAVAGEIV